MDKIKVLWMNNGDESLHTFSLKASDNYIMVETCQSIAKCAEMLSSQHSKWHVLLLNIDYEIKEGRLKGTRKTNSIDIDFINNKVKGTPYYLVTDGEKLSRSANTLVKLIKKKVYYLKKEADLLFQRIKLDYEQLIPVRYEKICRFCQYPGLIDLLKILESNDKKESIERNSKIPNQVRIVLEWLKKDSLLFKGKAIPAYIQLKIEKEKDYKKEKPIDEQPLNIFSKIVGHSSIVPVYVKRSIYACTSTNQRGSHYTDINKAILAGSAPYVTRSLIYELLNILYWCASLDEKTFEL